MAQGQPVSTPPITTDATGTAVAAPRRRRLGVNTRDLPYVILFVGPALVFIGLLVIYPAIKTLYSSLTSTTGIGFNTPTQFVGLDNFNTMLNDPVMHTAVILSLIHI